MRNIFLILVIVIAGFSAERAPWIMVMEPQVRVAIDESEEGFGAFSYTTMWNADSSLIMFDMDSGKPIPQNLIDFLEPYPNVYIFTLDEWNANKQKLGFVENEG